MDPAFPSDGSLGYVGKSGRAVIPDMGEFSAANLSSLTPQQVLSAYQSEESEAAMEVVRRARTPCSFFNSGSCKWGTRCSFYHGPAESKEVDAGMAACESALSAGDLVEIIGLKSAQKLNKRRGKVTSFEPSSQRYAVVPDGDKVAIAIRRGNLRRVHT